MRLVTVEFSRASLLTSGNSIASLGAVDIKAYLKKHKLSQEVFADQVGVSQGLVWQWLDGRTRITAERAIEIEDKTDGEITRHDLRPDLYPKVRAA